VLLLGLASLAVVVVLGLLAGRARSPVAERGRVADERKQVVGRPAAPPPPTWRLRPAPPDERISVWLTPAPRSGLLFDVETGAVLWQLQPRSRLPIASLTKMMTALVVVARSRPTDRVLITWQATHFAGSGVGLLPLGKRVPELALLYGLLLPSGNDAAIALAQHVAGTQQRFIAMMNARARAIGLDCSHFATVSGLVDEDNYSCADDLAVLAHAVLEQPLLARIVASRSAVLPFPIKGGRLFLYNNNPLLIGRYPGADGVKTGYTNASGPCLVAAARRGRTWLGVVLLNSANDAAQAEELLDAGFAKIGRR
jgi:D-alanyl-D-alanine carboxypeptidase (penicillin-binding protein 5/6)